MRGSLLGAVGRAGLADGRGRAMIVSQDVQDADRPISHSKSLIEIRRERERERERERRSSSVRPTINKVPRDRVTPPFVMKLYGAVGGTNERRRR